MAERRMFAKSVTDSDEFIDMPSATQALYLHLNQSADDDGFTNQTRLAMWKSHASPDDLRVLASKGFILQFESGVIVITHWRASNQIRNDRRKKTRFIEEAKRVFIDDSGTYEYANETTPVEKLVSNQELPSPKCDTRSEAEQAFC